MPTYEVPICVTYNFSDRIEVVHSSKARLLARHILVSLHLPIFKVSLRCSIGTKADIDTILDYRLNATANAVP